jgi:hypothetical protein
MVMVRSLPEAEEGQDSEDYDHEADEVDDPVHLLSPLTQFASEKCRNGRLVALIGK